MKFVDEFPMTVTGKVRKVEMREQSIAELGLAAAVGHRNRLTDPAPFRRRSPGTDADRVADR